MVGMAGAATIASPVFVVAEVWVGVGLVSILILLRAVIAWR